MFNIVVKNNIKIPSVIVILSVVTLPTPLSSLLVKICRVSPGIVALIIYHDLHPFATINLLETFIFHQLMNIVFTILSLTCIKYW